MKNIGVIGCGIMGGGIAQVAAQNNYNVTVLEIEEGYLSSGIKRIEHFLDKSVEKEKIAPGKRDSTLKRIKGTLDINDLKECDLVIEAAVEDISVKQNLFRKIDTICNPNTIFASNTSSLTVIEIASVTTRQEKFLGLHFFNPVPLMPLVEVVRTIKTSDDSYQNALKFIENIKKIPISAKDSPGFIVNLLLVPYLLDAVRILGEGIATIEDIDNGMKYGCGYPMGPLALLDLIGIDVIYKITHIMYKEYREKKYAAPPLLKQMVLAGYHGKKTGKGFYDYSQKEPVPMNSLV